MLDKNGIEIKTGDIVRITGTYFKTDNALYFVEHSDGDPDWCGKDHCLLKIKRNGELSKAKNSTCFWPIMVTVNGYEKYTTAKLWNKEHAQIEIVEGIDKAHIAEYFRDQSQQCDKWIERYSWDFGENSRSVNDQKQYKAFYDSVVARLEGMA